MGRATVTTCDACGATTELPRWWYAVEQSDKHTPNLFAPKAYFCSLKCLSNVSAILEIKERREKDGGQQ
jgi:hypothetical protein